MKKNDMAICLWFDNQAEEAVRYYTSIFKDSETGHLERYTNEGLEYNEHASEGSVLAIEFRLNDMKFMALNGGPLFKFNESVSVMVYCDTQDEIDYYWNKLTGEGGEESMCGWLKDKYGVSWQIVPSILKKYLAEGNMEKMQRFNQALYKMRKLIIADLQNAYDGKVKV
jgi:predicted 3-demethylubiquinone-9 3-methyltransferase (glyoxalase superfamily)